MSEPVPLPGWRADPLLCRQAQPVPFERRRWDQPGAGEFQPWQIRAALPPQAEPMPAQQEAAPAAPEPPADAPAAAVESVAEPAACTAAALEAARSEAFAEGQRSGRAQARQEIELERSRERALLHSLGAELQGLSQQPQRFFEPLKRLALHLAEQIVRAELQVSGKVIAGLIEQSLAQLDHPGEAAAVVSLHPDDLRRLQGLSHELHEGLSLEADPALRPGSVRIRVQDAQVEDLIEHRLEALARRLLADPEAWLDQSALLHRPLVADSREDRVEEGAGERAGGSAPPWTTQVVEFGADDFGVNDLDADDFAPSAPGTDGSRRA